MQALIAGAFVCGLGVGVYYDSEVVLSPQNLSSTQIIDRSSPNSDVCMAYGGWVCGWGLHILQPLSLCGDLFASGAAPVSQTWITPCFYHACYIPPGYSSSVFDMKLYVTYNPFNVREGREA